MRQVAESPPPSLEALLVRFRDRGDPAALARLFDETAGGLFRVAVAVVDDEAAAEDALQETFLAVIQDAASWDHARPALPWLMGILHHKVGDARRRASRTRAARAVVADAETADVDADGAEDAARVHAAIDALREPYRSVALLRWRYGLEPASIAHVRNEPPGTTRSLLSRALARLRRSLAGTPAAVAAGPGPRGLEAIRESVMRAAGRGIRRKGLATLLEAIMAKKILAAAALVLLLWMGWRVVALESEVDRLSRRPEPLAAAASETPPTATPPTQAERDGPRLGPSSTDDVALARRISDLEKRLDALASRLHEVEVARDEQKALLADLVAAQAHANDLAAVATSRNVISAQAQFQVSAKCDVDRDGTGEYGGFVEMSGGVAGRMASPLNPPVLSGAFRTLTAAGEALRSGYYYRVFLPDSRGTGVGEPQVGFERGIVNADLAETTWCMYAWPAVYGVTGTRTYFTNQGGDVLATDSHVYSGSGGGPASDAAFTAAGKITGATAIGIVGSDGNVWKQVN